MNKDINMKNRPVYSVVVPVYNSDSSVKELLERLINVFEKEVKASYEVIFVDDGSTRPSTWPMLDRLNRDNETVTSVKLRRNFGRTSAILCGLNLARGQWIITMDDDLQHLPEDIVTLIEHRAHDVVVGNFRKKQHTRSQIFTSWIKSGFDRIILGVPCKMSSFILFKYDVIRGMLQISSASPFLPALMTYVTSDIVSIEVRHMASMNKESRYNFFTRFKQFSNLLIGNSSLVLRTVGLFGMSVSSAGFLYALYIIIKKLLGHTYLTGWASLVVINLFFGGFILMALGIIGEYLIRILAESYGKPPFIIREIRNARIFTDNATLSNEESEQKP